MAETLLSFGVEKLWDLLVRESDRFQGVEEQFNELKSDLDLLRCFLEDADAKKHTSAVVRNTVKEIKEIVYDAEDIIETFLLKEELGKTSGIWHTVRRFSKRRELAFDMKSISKRISKVSRYMQSLGVQQDSAYRDTQSLLERQREMRQTFSSDNEDHLVGLEKNVEQLVGYLVEQDSNQVVSITGMGGIGKTTLARQVFNHEMVKNHFDGVAWVCISQQFTRTYVWQTILQQLSSKHDEHRESNMTEDYLQKKLFLLLETSNYLIILDDMWKEEDWDRIKPVFPSKKGWKVLVTSRNERVALRADPTCVTFKPECLTIEESWTLFRRIAFPRKDTLEYNVDEDMEEMGKKMIKHCGGLPLAVKVLGGLLASQHTLSEWNRVCENIGSHIVGGTSFNERNISSVYHLLSLSFEELPVYLKQCFLYFAHFPEDYPIRVWDLAYYWAAEGIPRPMYYDGATIREVANGYIEELVKRNMVISKRDVTTSRFETCHLHDMMREVCLRKAEEENFVHIVDIANSQSSCTSRRIAVHQFDETYYPKWEMEESLSGLLQNPKLRSIWFINFTWKKVWMESRLCFTRLKLMRVLDLSYTIFEGGKLLSDIGKLIHLRYLSLYRAKVSHLPSSMRNLKLLLYLNLDVVARSLLYMAPNFLKEMRELTYLSLPLNMHEKTKLELGNLVNLETLLHFSTKNSSVRDLHRMTKLRTLKIWNCPKLKELPNGFPQLHTLDLGGLDEWEEWIVEEGSMPLLHFLSIRLCPKLKKLPDGQHFPSHLTTINLIGCRLVEDPMPTLEKLLHLKKVTLPKSFSGRRMVCSGGGFPQLHTLELSGLEELEEWIVEEGSMPLLHSLNVRYCLKLKKLPAGGFPQLQKLFLHGLKEWEEWIVEEGSMPLLHTLEICDCEKLKKLPDGLRFIYSLKDLSLDKEWKERTSDGGEDYYKIQHIPFVEFY